MKTFVVWIAALLLFIGSARAACTDSAAVASTRAAAELQCPCAMATGHVPYAKCVAHVAKAAVKTGSLPKDCRAAVVRCAKKSTCGKTGFVTCCRTTAAGISKCSVKSSEAKCKPPMGGSACMGAAPSCCDSCAAGSCGATTPTTTPGATTTTMSGPQTHTVMVGPGGALTFNPARLTIAVGDTVHWVWKSAGHSVVSGTDGNADGRFCSPSDTGCDDPPLSNMGATYEHTFAQAGTFPYYCSAHVLLGMTGSIKVQ
jgi:plastocyanin